MNSELQVQIEQYEQLVTQLQDDQLYSQQTSNDL